MTKRNTSPAVAEPQAKTLVALVEDKVKKFQMQGDIRCPKNYSPQNALKSAWLQIQEVQDMSRRPALEVCTRESIANALLSMVVQGLNPDKKQCYFIVYGNKLVCQRSYFGSVAVAKQVDSRIDDIVGDVIYAGDVFKTIKRHGKTIVTEHQQDFDNIDKDNIVGAYATILYKDGKEESLVMTMAQIKQAWAQSQTKPVLENGQLKANSTHAKFTGDMAVKTVVGKIARRIINTSDDYETLKDYFNQAEDIAVEASAEMEADTFANKTMLETEYTINEPQEPEIEPETIDIETGEIVIDEAEIDEEAPNF